MTLRQRLLRCTRANTPELSLKDKVRPAKVLSVYDGDTVRIALRFRGVITCFNTRCYGYDCAEMRPSRSLPEEERAEEKRKAIAARDFLRSHVLGDDVLVHCKPHGFDKYGRLLVTLFKDERKKPGQSLNELMVEEGHGYPYDGGNKKAAKEKAAKEQEKEAEEQDAEEQEEVQEAGTGPEVSGEPL